MATRVYISKNNLKVIPVGKTYQFSGAKAFSSLTEIKQGSGTYTLSFHGIPDSNIGGIDLDNVELSNGGSGWVPATRETLEDFIDTNLGFNFQAGSGDDGEQNRQVFVRSAVERTINSGDVVNIPANDNEFIYQVHATGPGVIQLPSDLTSSDDGWFVTVRNKPTSNSDLVVLSGGDTLDLLPGSEAVILWNGEDFIEYIESPRTVKVDYFSDTLEAESYYTDVPVAMKSPGNWYINLPALDTVEDLTVFKFIRNGEKKDRGIITPLSGELISNEVNKEVHGRGYIEILKTAHGWAIIKEALFDQYFMEGGVRELQFENSDSVHVEHEFGYCPIVQVFVEYGTGNYVLANVNINHDWATKNSFTIQLSQPSSGKILY